MYDFSISVFGFACLWHLGPKCPISCQEVVLEALASNSGALRFSTLKSQRSFALLAVETAGQRDRGGVKLFNGETGLLEVGGYLIFRQPHFQPFLSSFSMIHLMVILFTSKRVCIRSTCPGMSLEHVSAELLEDKQVVLAARHCAFSSFSLD